MACWVLVLREGRKRIHFVHELIETTESEFAKTSGSSWCQTVTTMIVFVNDKFSMHQRLSEFRIAADMLAESMGDLNDSANILMTAPFHARYRKSVSACKLESLWF